MNYEIYGEVLPEIDDGLSLFLKNVLSKPFVQPRYKLVVLNPDETVSYEVPEEDILGSSIQYSEEYQNGQRRSLSVTLLNANGKYTPSITGIWIQAKFAFYIGIKVKESIVWFQKGVYVMGNTSLTSGNSEKTVQLSLQDKYHLFEGKTGILEDSYEIPEGSDIIQAIKDIMNFSLGNGYILDYQDIICDPSFYGKKTQAAVRAEAGGSLSTLIDSLATQLSAEYYYNSVGNFCLYSINETVNDDVKPIIWTYKNLSPQTHSLSLNYKNEDVVNYIKVIGENISGGICSAIAQNDNPVSPICVQLIGKRVQSPYSESNVFTDDSAMDYAQYYLRKSSFLAVSFSASVTLNPLLAVNNICEAENSNLNMQREKLLITSISYSSDSGEMSLQLNNTSDLPFILKKN